MKKIVFLTPPDAEYGFSLAGITQQVVTPDKREDALSELMADADNGLIIIDERLMAPGDEERLREQERSWHGVFMILPSPERLPPEAEDYAARLIRRAIGYHVRLNV